MDTDVMAKLMSNEDVLSSEKPLSVEALITDCMPSSFANMLSGCLNYDVLGTSDLFSDPHDELGIIGSGLPWDLVGELEGAQQAFDNEDDDDSDDLNTSLDARHLLDIVTDDPDDNSMARELMALVTAAAPVTTLVKPLETAQTVVVTPETPTTTAAAQLVMSPKKSLDSSLTPVDTVLTDEIEGAILTADDLLGFDRHLESIIPTDVNSLFMQLEDGGLTGSDVDVDVVGCDSDAEEPLIRAMPLLPPTRFGGHQLKQRPTRSELASQESEVMRLLKTKTPVAKVTQSAPSTPPATPSKEMINKIKNSNKCKSIIMLPTALPSKGERGGKAVEPASPLMPRKLQRLRQDVSQSAPASPAGCSKHEDSDCSDVDILEVSSDYFEVTVDHDYCQNVPQPRSSPAKSAPINSKPSYMSTKPRSMNSKLVSMSGKPLSMNSKPASMSGKPLSMSGKPLSMSGKPLSMSGKPLSMSGKPLSMSGKPLSMSGKLLSMSGKPLSMSGKPLSMSSKSVSLHQPGDKYRSLLSHPPQTTLPPPPSRKQRKMEQKNAQKSNVEVQERNLPDHKRAHDIRKSSSQQQDAPVSKPFKHSHHDPITETRGHQSSQQHTSPDQKRSGPVDCNLRSSSKCVEQVQPHKAKADKKSTMDPRPQPEQSRKRPLTAISSELSNPGRQMSAAVWSGKDLVSGPRQPMSAAVWSPNDLPAECSWGSPYQPEHGSISLPTSAVCSPAMSPVHTPRLEASPAKSGKTELQAEPVIASDSGTPTPAGSPERNGEIEKPKKAKIKIEDYVKSRLGRTLRYKTDSPETGHSPSLSDSSRSSGVDNCTPEESILKTLSTNEKLNAELRRYEARQRAEQALKEYNRKVREANRAKKALLHSQIVDNPKLRVSSSSPSLQSLLPRDLMQHSPPNVPATSLGSHGNSSLKLEATSAPVSRGTSPPAHDNPSSPPVAVAQKAPQTIPAPVVAQTQPVVAQSQPEPSAVIAVSGFMVQPPEEATTVPLADESGHSSSPSQEKYLPTSPTLSSSPEAMTATCKSLASSGCQDEGATTALPPVMDNDPLGLSVDLHQDASEQAMDTAPVMSSSRVSPDMETSQSSDDFYDMALTCDRVAVSSQPSPSSMEDEMLGPVNMDLEEASDEEQNHFSRFEAERPQPEAMAASAHNVSPPYSCPDPLPVDPTPEVIKKSHAHRNYRRREASPAPQTFDKLPSYYTANVKPGKQISAKASFIDKLDIRGIPDRDRDPSPDRNEPVFDKLPAYFSCFTNSTQYDDSMLEKPDSPEPSVVDSRSSSPGLIISSRANSPSCANSCSLTTSRNVSPAASRPSSRHVSPAISVRSARDIAGRTDLPGPSRRRRRRHHSGPRSRSPGHHTSRGHTSRRHRRSFSSSRSSSRSYSRSRSRSPIKHSRRSRCRSRSWSSSRSRSRSPYSRRRSRSRSPYSRRGHRERLRRERSLSRERRLEQAKWTEMKKQKQIEERRIVYVGRIPRDFTPKDLRRQFSRFGEIEESKVHIRESGGDNYGFITFLYTCDAYAAIEKGNTVAGMEEYDLCFGGRRQFCKTDYADLDGNKEEEEEMAPVVRRSPEANLDFDALLRQAMNRKR